MMSVAISEEIGSAMPRRLAESPRRHRWLRGDLGGGQSAVYQEPAEEVVRPRYRAGASRGKVRGATRRGIAQVMRRDGAKTRNILRIGRVLRGASVGPD